MASYPHALLDLPPQLTPWLFGLFPLTSPVEFLMRQHLRLDWLPGLLVARPHFELSFRREERSSSSIRTLNSGNPNSSWPISFELHSNTQCFPEPRLHRSERKQSGPKLRFELNNPLIFFLIYSSYLTSLVPNSQGGVRRYSNRSLY